MSIIPEVKCRRCGESFSALRSTCPNCGTRRVAQSSRTPDTTPSTVKGTASYERAAVNTRWQLIFGLILVVAVILAVIVMVSTGLNSSESGNSTTPKNTPTPPVEDTQPTVEPAPTPSPTPTPSVQTLTIRYAPEARDLKGQFTMHVGDPAIALDVLITPTDITGPVKWTCEDDTLLKLTVDPTDPKKCSVEMLQAFNGGTKITVELYGQTAECIVYCGG